MRHKAYETSPDRDRVQDVLKRCAFADLADKSEELKDHRTPPSKISEDKRDKANSYDARLAGMLGQQVKSTSPMHTHLTVSGGV